MADAEAQSTEILNTLVSNIQEADVEVSGNAITGTLKYLSEGDIVEEYGAGNFIALKFVVPEAATSMLVRVDDGTPVEMTEVETANGVFKIDEDSETLTIVATDGDITFTKTYDLTGLTLEEEEE